MRSSSHLAETPNMIYEKWTIFLVANDSSRSSFNFISMATSRVKCFDYYRCNRYMHWMLRPKLVKNAGTIISLLNWLFSFIHHLCEVPVRRDVNFSRRVFIFTLSYLYTLGFWYRNLNIRSWGALFSAINVHVVLFVGVVIMPLR